jgi:hypothetical protein
MFSNTDSWVSEFIESHQFFFIDDSIKEKAPGILSYFMDECHRSFPNFPQDVDTIELKNILENKLIHLDLPAAIKLGIPLLCSEFALFISASTLYLPAKDWSPALERAQKAYQSRVTDKKVKGVSIQYDVSKTNRNDPCPCGSGKKFKKCCS